MPYPANTCPYLWSANWPEMAESNLLKAINLWQTVKPLQNWLHSATTWHTFTWKVANVAVTECWLSCAETAALLSPWAKTAADQWNKNRNTIYTTSCRTSNEKSGKWAKILRQNYNQACIGGSVVALQITQGQKANYSNLQWNPAILNLWNADIFLNVLFRNGLHSH